MTDDEEYICSDESIRLLLGILAGKRNDLQWQQVLPDVNDFLSMEIHKHFIRLHGKDGIYGIASETGLADNDHELLRKMLEEAIASFPKMLDVFLKMYVPVLFRIATLGASSVPIKRLDERFQEAVKKRVKDRRARLRSIIRKGKSEAIERVIIETIRSLGPSEPDKTKVAWKFYQETKKYEVVKQEVRDKVLDRFNKLYKSHQLNYEEMEKRALEKPADDDRDLDLL
ncbi:MAG: hypothetical protein MOB07_02525 [Acidobacteria bacterium]|nr:hypothetical protein [Acidobacteriota bacterium]